MRKIEAWLRGWASTLYIRLFDRDTYRALREPFNPEDFTEARRPGDSFDQEAGHG